MRTLAAVLFGATLVGALAAEGATVRGTLRVRGKPAEDAVVYLERVAGPLPHPPPAPVVMDQKNLAFAPHVLPLVAGTTVRFTNSDDIQHNVFSPSREAGAFDLGTYSRGEERSVTMQQPGDVLVLCNIHMEMEGHILVLRDPTFAATDAAGRYEIRDVPPGRYTLKVWRKAWLPVERAVDVPAADALAVDVDG